MKLKRRLQARMELLEQKTNRSLEQQHDGDDQEAWLVVHGSAYASFGFWDDAPDDYGDGQVSQTLMDGY